MRQSEISTYNIPIFIPHEGCPHDCAFCNQRKITGVTTSMTAAAVRQTVEEGLRYLREKESAQIEIAFFGGSFTGLPMAEQEEFLRAVQDFSAQVDGIRVSTRPDCINPEIADLLRKYGVRTVELGVQSSDEGVLSANRRGHTFADVRSAVSVLKNSGFRVGLQMMVGMWRSSPEKDAKTAEDIIALRPDCVRIYPTVILHDTALERLYRDGRYLPYSQEEAIEVCKRLLIRFREENIPVIRLGLHSGEELRAEGAVVAGPFHPAFGELVESRIYRDRLEAECIRRQLRGGMLTVFCQKSEVSKIVGHKGCNREYLREKYGVRLKMKTAALSAEKEKAAEILIFSNT